MKAKLNYGEKRLAEAGITEELNKFPVEFFDNPIVRDVPLFKTDESGHLLIRYLHLDGSQVYYDYRGKLKPFFRKRLAKPVGEMKYHQPVKSGVHIYWTPSIIEKYKEKQQIKTLFITEGELKAFVGYLNGIDIAGIGGIHNFVDKDKNRLNDEIEKLINRCNIKNLVLLFDADCLSINFEKRKDLYQRPNSFYSAVKRFKELAAPLNVDVYFSHILKKHEEKAKGLDDLINHPDTYVKWLVNELYQLAAGTDKQYLHTLSVSENSIHQLRKYFAIDTVENFYSKHVAILQEQEFVFKGSRYRHNGKKLQMMRHADADKFMRVGCDYYKKTATINSRKVVEATLRKWKTTEINRDYTSKGYSDFFNQINKYDGFCNIPDNTDQYQRIHTFTQANGTIINYNLYEPIDHSLEYGEFSNTIAFLQHLFKQESDENFKFGDPFLVALDYLTILYHKPTQMLPVLCLVSVAQGTGKTTFLKWLKAIFKSNATILGNSEFKMDFNTHYISKLLIMIDESFIELDKKHEKERVKKLATSTQQFYQPKGVDATEIEYFGKLIMCSNNERNFIPLEKTDIRFYVVKVDTFEKEDPDFLEKLIEEIPFFLHYLNRRKVFHPKKTRAWFSNEHLVTPQFMKVVKTTRSKLEQDIRAYVEEIILTHKLEEYKIDATRLTKAVNELSKYKHSASDIRAFLKEECNMLPLPSHRYKIPTSYPDTTAFDENSVNYEEANGRPYVFKREVWVEEEDEEEDEDDSG